MTTVSRAGGALAAVALCFAVFFADTAVAVHARAAPTPRVVAYVPNWNDLAGFSPTIPYSKITQINIAFENPTNDVGDLSFNAGDAILIAGAHAHHVQVLVSIGGGSASTDALLQARYGSLLKADRRAAFVARIAAYLRFHHFDGLDVDIEGPAITGDYGAFIEELARVLKPTGTLLTAALSKGYGGDKVPDSVLARLDYVNIMAYDAVGPWNPNSPGQHSSLAFARSTVDYWIGRGLPRSKAVLGVPFYGYGFGGAFRKNEYDYSEIVVAHPGAENGDQVGETIWYNGIPTIKAKARLVVESGLGGIMIWSLDTDAPGGKSLLSAIVAGLRGTQKAPPALGPTR